MNAMVMQKQKRLEDNAAAQQEIDQINESIRTHIQPNLVGCAGNAFGDGVRGWGGATQGGGGRPTRQGNGWAGVVCHSVLQW